ncbi:glucosaminidase domain-containing protein [Flammeovirga sp. MY04]|uniref:glucosaminidase domain-containing protein n=1 Tax=Flammeovirga sp. MY04 TaxID=1191459 RepID=UPI0013051F83|nr:glucosaminidase domain-containing protein [Flammeovirga sp. MY04]ANQ48501.2 glucosaminidase domain-containing protein [Flammeovirga sp. MY04]
MTKFREFWNVPTQLIFAQTRLETGRFTSGIFKDINNLFGMNHPSRRETTSLGNSGRKESSYSVGFATYKNWYDSIVDYFLRQENFNIVPKMNEFIDDGYSKNQSYMMATKDSNYFEDPEYIEKWESSYKASTVYKILSFFLPILVGFVVVKSYDNIPYSLKNKFKFS